MHLDYDSDEEHSGLPPATSYEYHPCMEGPMQMVVGEDKEEAPLPPPEMAPEYSGIPGSEHLVRQSWKTMEEQRKTYQDLLSGNKSPEWTEEQLLAHEVMKAMRDQEEELAGLNVKVARSKHKLRLMRAKKQPPAVNILMSNWKKVINELGTFKGDWESIELTVDSGAADTVTPPDTLDKIEVDLTSAQKDGFTVADGFSVPNLGAKAGVMATQECSNLRRISFQVAPVHKALLSVSQMINDNHRVVFDQEWSYLEDKATGERTSLVRRNGLLVLQAWVRPRKDSKAKEKEENHSPETQKNDATFQRPARSNPVSPAEDSFASVGKEKDVNGAEDDDKDEDV